MKFGDWIKEKRAEQKEIKAAEKGGYESKKDIANAENQRKAIEEAEARGKEKAYEESWGLKPNPKKIAAIKSGLAKMSEKAATAHERIKSGEMDKFTTPPGERGVKAKTNIRKRVERSTPPVVDDTAMENPEKRMDEYNKKMRDVLGY